MSAPVHTTRRAADAGFTLLELVVAMGLLASFLLLLVQLLSSSAGLFNAGERSQELADRAMAASRAVREALSSMAGPRAEVPPGEGELDARLIVHWVGTGGAPEPGAPRPPRVPVVRSTVRLAPATEDRLLAEALRPLAVEQVGENDPALLAARLEELVASWPRSGRGELLLTAWPSDPSGEFLDLRVGLRLADPELMPENELPLVMFEFAEDLALDSGTMRRTTRVEATDLLHFGVLCESQRTEFLGSGGSSGGESAWDSARAGLLLAPDDEREAFGLDLGGFSLADPRDDLWPRWMRVVVTVGRGPLATPEAFLTRSLDPEDRELTVASTDDLPERAVSPWVKVGTEWIRYSEQQGNRLVGLERGGRGTVPAEHPTGTPVRAGREVTLWIRVPHGRDGDV